MSFIKCFIHNVLMRAILRLILLMNSYLIEIFVYCNKTSGNKIHYLQKRNKIRFLNIYTQLKRN
jgi:hypothetical protein